ncbi:MAG: BspA family leucine-rich repeat surface protein [Clostridia bacterium]|nr:BspA family leucine-rich repeat surface protein [Clostridia bacterium]
MKHISEFLVNSRINKKIDQNTVYKYHPKTKDELVFAILDHFDNDIYDLNDIDVSKIANMSNLFARDVLFQYIDKDFDVSNWDVSNVTYMTNMFYGWTEFTGKGLKNWNVSNVEDMTQIFKRI